jgi:hypothetical protein
MGDDLSDDEDESSSEMRTSSLYSDSIGAPKGGRDSIAIVSDTDGGDVLEIDDDDDDGQ